LSNAGSLNFGIKLIFTTALNPSAWLGSSYFFLQRKLFIFFNQTIHKFHSMLQFAILMHLLVHVDNHITDWLMTIICIFSKLKTKLVGFVMK